MRRETVETLAFGLPSASPYFRRVFGTWLSGQAPSERDRIEKALFDPAFGSNVAGSYGVPVQSVGWAVSIPSITSAPWLEIPPRYAPVPSSGCLGTFERRWRSMGTRVERVVIRLNLANLP